MKNRNRAAINAVLNPSAHTETLCGLADIGKTEIETKLAWVNSLPGLSMPMKTLINLQFTSGLRVSEALGIKASDMMYNGMIRIRSSKGSISRIIHYSDNDGYLEFCRKIGKQPFAEFNRFFVYREYKKLGIITAPRKSTKQAVTHAPRHMLAQAMQKAFRSAELTQDLLRQKSNRSTQYYASLDE